MLLRGLILALLFTVAHPSFSADKRESWIEVRSPHFRVISNAGDKLARRTAGQFERFREVFHSTMTKQRLDSATPLLIIAVKDEKGLKTLLPGYWEKKGSAHPPGIYASSLGKNFIVLRLDAGGEDPYQLIYHEFTHSLMSLNFGPLPLWFTEGIAEFFGHAKIEEKEAGTGRASFAQLHLLRENRLLPLTTLLTVDHTSPYYNEADKTSLFYAQSWALTHFLIFADKGSRQPQLTKFVSLAESGVPDLEAAQRAFGDLKKLEGNLEEYVHLAAYRYLPVKLGSASDETKYAVREVSEAEALAIRGDFLMHNRHFPEALAMLQESLRLDPSQSLAEESLGFYYFHQGDRAEAARHLSAAVHLDTANYLAHFYYAMLSPGQQDNTGIDLVETHLRKTIALNPEFAQAYSALARHYSSRGIKMADALQLAKKAAQLEPGVIAYHLNVARVLLRVERVEEAVDTAQRALKTARSDEDRAMAQSFLSEAARFQEYLAQKKRVEEEAAASRKEREEEAARRDKEQKASEEAVAQQEASAQKDTKPGKLSASAARRSVVEGKVADVTCGPPASMYIALTAGNKAVRLHAYDYFKIEYFSLNWKPPDNFQPCLHLNGLSVKVTYTAVEGKPYLGEILSIEVTQ